MCKHVGIGVPLNRTGDPREFFMRFVNNLFMELQLVYGFALISEGTCSYKIECSV